MLSDLDLCMDEKTRDALLAILSIGGVFYFVKDLAYGLILALVRMRHIEISLTTVMVVPLLQSLVLLICGLAVFKYVKLSDCYHKYFIRLFVLMYLLDLILKIVSLAIRLRTI